MAIATGQQALAADVNALIPAHAVNTTPPGVHRWTADKLLKGAGTGANPTEIANLISSIRACEELRNSNDTERTTTAANYTKLKEVKLNEASLTSIRIKFDMKAASAESVQGQIYRNGAAIGTEQTANTTSYVTFTEDFDASAWAVNDLIQVYAKRVSSSTVYVQNFRFYYGIVFSTTNQDPA